MRSCVIASRARATAMLEFALISIPLIFLLLGASGVSEVLRVQLAVDEAAQEVARAAAAVRPAIGGELEARDQAEQRATQRALNVLDTDGLGWPRGSLDQPLEVESNYTRRIGTTTLVSVRLTFRYAPRLGGPVVRQIFPTGIISLQGVAASAARAGASAVSVDALNLTESVTLNPFDTDQVRAAVDEVCSAYASNRDLDGLQCSAPVIGDPPTRGLAGAACATFAVQETNRKHVVPLAVKVTATRPVSLHFLRVLSGKATIELSQTQWATPVTGP